jgi:hypothetical protein
VQTNNEAKAYVTRLKNAISGKETHLAKKESEFEVEEHLKKLLEMLKN